MNFWEFVIRRKIMRFKSSILIGLMLSNFSGLTQSFVDTSFNPGTGAGGGFIESMVIQPDSKILISGSFTSFNGVNRAYVARLNTNGSVDTSFNSQVGYWVRHMALQPDGKVLIGGFFGNVGVNPYHCIAR